MIDDNSPLITVDELCDQQRCSLSAIAVRKGKMLQNQQDMEDSQRSCSGVYPGSM